MLEEARKYRLRLVMANQYTKQIKHKNEAVFDSIKWNIGTFIALWLGSDDSQVLAPHFGISSLDMVNLPPLHWYVKCEEYSTKPFNIKMNFVERDPNKVYPWKTAIKNRSYEKYWLESVEENVSDEFIIAKKKIFRHLISMKTFSKKEFRSKLRVNWLVFNKIVETLFIEWYLSYDENKKVKINKDLFDIKDDSFFEIEYEELVNKEKWYVSLATYFRENGNLPKFSYNLDSYDKDFWNWNFNNLNSFDKTNKDPIEDDWEEAITFDSKFWDEEIEEIPIANIDFLKLKECCDLERIWNEEIYTYKITQFDTWTTWLTLSEKLWFTNYNTFTSIIQVNKMIMNTDDIISNVQLWQNITIKI